MNRFPKLMEQVVGKALGSKCWDEVWGTQSVEGAWQVYRAPEKAQKELVLTGDGLPSRGVKRDGTGVSDETCSCRGHTTDILAPPVLTMSPPNVRFAFLTCRWGNLVSVEEGLS